MYHTSACNMTGVSTDAKAHLCSCALLARPLPARVLSMAARCLFDPKYLVSLDLKAFYLPYDVFPRPLFASPRLRFSAFKVAFS